MSGLSEREIAAFQAQAWPLRLRQEFIDLAGQIKDNAVAAAREEAAAAFAPFRERMNDLVGIGNGNAALVGLIHLMNDWDKVAADIRKGDDRG